MRLLQMTPMATIFQRLSTAAMAMISASFRRPRFSVPILPRSYQFGIGIFLIALVVLVLFVFVDLDFSKVVLKNAPAGSTVREVFLLVSALGSSAWILVLSAVIWGVVAVLARADEPRQRRAVLLNLQADASFVFWAVAISGTCVSLIKNTIGRARPRYIEELGPYYFDFAAFTSGFASFPSGHSTTFGAMCMALYLLFPRFGLLLLMMAILGGLSRVVVGSHYISDVIAGLCFGALSTLLLARWLAKRGGAFEFGQSMAPVRKKRP